MTPDRWILVVLALVAVVMLFGPDAVRRFKAWHAQARQTRLEFEKFMQAEDERRALGRVTYPTDTETR